jgi:hypothetical protein
MSTARRRSAILALVLAALVTPATAGARELTVTQNTLTFTRADGSALVIARHTRVSCRTFRHPTPTHVISVVGGPASRRSRASRWEIEVAPREVSRSPLLKFPSTVGFGDLGSPHVFVYDRTTRNELSSSEEEAAGSMTVRQAACSGSSIRLSFTIDATLDSEIGLPKLRVRGAFAARATE